MNTFVQEIEEHLKTRLIPFWESLKDQKYGGYYGWLGYDLKLDKEYEKGCILNSRILWFFSSAYELLKEKNLKEDADHAYEFLKNYCIDREYGGVFWSVTYDGKPKDTTKHTYNQAFAIYALSSYYNATGCKDALDIARGLQLIIEEKMTDEYGYLEAFTRDFRPESNEKLSENGVLAEKTMNTLLHVFEAYTEFYRVTKDPFTGERLRFMMDLFADKVYNRELKRQEVFFDRTWNSLIDLYSYGHDIEASWLIHEAALELGDKDLLAKVEPIVKQIAIAASEGFTPEGGMIYEKNLVTGHLDADRHWWVQAETVVGYMNIYQYFEDKEALQKATACWEFIKSRLIDRENGEWYWSIRADDTVNRTDDKAGFWKCPYHNGRMCLEVMERFGDE